MRFTIQRVRNYLAGRSPRQLSEPGTTHAAVAVIFCEPGPELLLIKRAERKGDPWSAQMALPGGRKDQCDQDLLQTVQRETREETGVSLSLEQLLGELDDVYPHTPILPPIVVRPFVFHLNLRPAVTLNDEATLHIWVPVRVLAGTAGTSRVSLRGREITTPSYRVGSHIVWGITQRILSPIMELWK